MLCQKNEKLTCLFSLQLKLINKIKLSWKWMRMRFPNIFRPFHFEEEKKFHVLFCQKRSIRKSRITDARFWKILSWRSLGNLRPHLPICKYAIKLDKPRTTAVPYEGNSLPSPHVCWDYENFYEVCEDGSKFYPQWARPCLEPWVVSIENFSNSGVNIVFISSFSRLNLFNLSMVCS